MAEVTTPTERNTSAVAMKWKLSLMFARDNNTFFEFQLRGAPVGELIGPDFDKPVIAGDGEGAWRLTKLVQYRGPSRADFNGSEHLGANRNDRQRLGGPNGWRFRGV